MNTRPFLLHALSPLHAGTGHTPDIIDLPTARMKATGIPFLPGSSIKGVLRDARRATDREKTEAVFGPSDDPAAHAGALVVGDARRWTAIVGIPLSAEPGTRHVLVRRDGAPERRVSFEVEPVKYAEQRLTVPRGKVDLSKEDLARYQREREHLAGVAATASDAVPVSFRFVQPTPGPASPWRSASPIAPAVRMPR